MKEILSKARWEALAKNYDAWWKNQSDRPMFHVRIFDHKFDGIPTCLSGYPLEKPMEEILSEQEDFLRSVSYLGDGYPVLLPDFGAGVNAAFLGAKHEVRPESVWFFPEHPVESAGDLHFFHHADAPLYRRIYEFYEKANEYFAGEVVLGMTHFNGGVDIISRFLNADGMCIAMYDEPEEVERLIRECHEAMVFEQKELFSLMTKSRGYSCWGDIFSSKPWFGAQCDFCALLGPKQFDAFVLPELQTSIREYPGCNYYHLDGREELIHLDKILAIPELQAVQWVAGVDERPDREWMELYKKITDAGKKLWYIGPEENLQLLADTLGSLKNVYWEAVGYPEDRERLLRTMERFGVPTKE